MKRKSCRELTVDGAQTRIFGLTQGIVRRFVCVCIALSLIGWAASFASDDQLFELKEVTDGVYIALARRVHVLNSNAAVIILDDGVLVVDTHSKPSAARALIKEIKTITDKPVRYVVDTHFHYDHFQGNGAYREAFPGVQVIASEPTRTALSIAASRVSRRSLPEAKVSAGTSSALSGAGVSSPTPRTRRKRRSSGARSPSKKPISTS